MSHYKKLLESFAKEINENAQQKHLLEIKTKLDELTLEREKNSSKCITDKSRELQSISDKNKYLAKEVSNMKKILKDQEKQNNVSAEKAKEKKEMEGKIRQLEVEMKQITVEKDKKEKETNEMKEILEKQRKENEELVNMLMQLRGIVSSKSLDNKSSTDNNKDLNTNKLSDNEIKRNKEVNKNKLDNKEDKTNGKEGTSKEVNKKPVGKKNNAGGKGNETTEQIIQRLSDGLEHMISNQNKTKMQKNKGGPSNQGNQANPSTQVGPSPNAPASTNKPKKPNQPNVLNQMNDLSGGKTNNKKTQNQPSSSKSNNTPNDTESKISNLGDKSKDKGGSYNLWDELENMKKKIKDGKISRNELCTKVSTMISDASKVSIPSKENFMTEVAECLQSVNQLPDKKKDINKKNSKPEKKQNPNMKKNNSSENLGKSKTKRQNKNKGQGNTSNIVQGGAAADRVEQEDISQDDDEEVEEANVPAGGKSMSVPVPPPRPSRDNLNIVLPESSQPDEQDDSPDDADDDYAKGEILDQFLGKKIPTLIEALTKKIDVTLKVKNVKMVALQDGNTICFEPTNLLDIVQFKQQYPKSVCMEDNN